MAAGHVRCAEWCLLGTGGFVLCGEGSLCLCPFLHKTWVQQPLWLSTLSLQRGQQFAAPQSSSSRREDC